MSDIVYKYRSLKSKFTERIITQNEIHYASVGELNDPYDVFPYVKPLTISDKEDIIVSLKLEGVFSQEQIKRGAKNLSNQELFYLVQKAFVNIGVLSLSKTCKSIMMWSHYADNHQGICFGFDIDEDRSCFRYPLSVEYKENRAVIDVKTINDISQIRNVLTRKNTLWGYEEELRCIDRFESINTNLTFQDQALKEIIFGWLVPEKEKIKIAKLCKQHNKKVDFYGMVMVNDVCYRLEPERLDYLKWI